MIIYVVRHGKTHQNELGLVQGIKEYDLTDKGINDTRELMPLVSNLGIDVVYSSPLKRAIDTAKILTDNKLPINIDDRIIERDWGFNEGMAISDVDTVNCWNIHLNTNDNKIEKIQDVMDRVSSFLEDIKIKYSDKKVLIVTHSAISRVIYYLLNPIPEDGDLSKIEIPNLRIIEYEY